MSLEQNYIVLWADIQELYKAVNTQRTRWSLDEVDIQGNPGIAKPSHIEELKNAIEDLRSTSAGSIATVDIEIPRTGTLLYPDIFDTINTTLDNLAGANASFNSSCFRFNSCSHSDCSQNGFYSISNYRSGFGGATDFF